MAPSFGTVRSFLTSGTLASALVFGSLAVEATEKEEATENEDSTDGEKAAEWVKDATAVKTPKAPARGMIQGRQFTVEKATISDSGILVLREGKEFFADLELMIFTFEHDEEKLPGKTFRFDVAPLAKSPHIHMKWREDGEGVPSSEVFMSKYSLTLEFGQPTKEGLPGSIYLCLPDEKKSFVAGTFLATKK